MPDAGQGDDLDEADDQPHEEPLEDGEYEEDDVD